MLSLMGSSLKLTFGNITYMSLIDELTREPAVELIKLAIAYYAKKYGRSVNAAVLAKLLFFIIYTDGTKLLNTPRIKLPGEFRIYSKGPSISIDEVLGGESKMIEYGIVRTGDNYYVKGIEESFEESYRSLVERGLRDLAEQAIKVVDEYGALGMDDLIVRSLEALGIQGEVIKAMAFNMSLEAYMDVVRRLRSVLESKGSIDEEDLYPDLFKMIG